jgi:hypothetical protein
MFVKMPPEKTFKRFAAWLNVAVLMSFFSWLGRVQRSLRLCVSACPTQHWSFHKWRNQCTAKLVREQHSSDLADACFEFDMDLCILKAHISKQSSRSVRLGSTKV